MIPILLVSFILRMIGINQSLWLDEATTARVIREYSFANIISKFSPYDFHPPFYYLFMKLWGSIFGTSEIALRMPSVLASLITGYIVYLIIRALEKSSPPQGWNRALWGAAFFLFNPLTVYYSQEARMYSLNTLFIALIFYYVLRIAKDLKPEKRIHQFYLANLFICLSLITFYGSIFFICTLYCFFLFKKSYKNLISLLPGFIIAAILLFPLFMQQLRHSGEVLQAIPNWSLTLGKANLKNLLLIPLKFSVGHIDWYPKIFYYVVAGLCTAVIVLFTVKDWKKFKSKNQLYLYWFLIAPLIFGFVFSFYKPVLQYFRFIFVLPFMVMVLGLSARNFIHRVAVLGIFVVFSLLYVLVPSFHREDWRSLVKNLPKSATVYGVASITDPIHYYRSDIQVQDIQKVMKTSIDQKNIYVIPYATDIYGINAAQYMRSNRFRLRSVRNERQVQLQIWQREEM